MSGKKQFSIVFTRACILAGLFVLIVLLGWQQPVADNCTKKIEAYKKALEADPANMVKYIAGITHALEGMKACNPTLYYEGQEQLLNLYYANTEDNKARAVATHLQDDFFRKTVISNTDTALIHACLLSVRFFYKNGPYDYESLRTANSRIIHQLDSLEKANAGLSAAMQASRTLAYQNLGLFYSGKMIDFQTAFTNYNKAIELCKSNPNDPIYISLLYNLAQLYRRQNNWQEAMPLYKKVIAATKSMGLTDLNMLSYSWLGACFLESSQNDSALYYTLLSLPAQKEKQEIVNNHAMVLLKTGHMAVAEKLLLDNYYVPKDPEESLSIEYIQTIYLLGETYAAKGKHAEALQEYSLCLFYNDAGLKDSLIATVLQHRFTTDYFQSATLMLRCMQGIARSLQALGRMQEALQAYGQLINMLAAIRNDLKSDESLYFINDNNNEIFQQALSLAHRLYTEDPQPAYVAKAFYFSEQYKASLLSKSLQQNEAQRNKALPEELIYLQSDINKQITALTKQQATATPDDSIPQKIQALELEKIEVENLIREKHPAYEASMRQAQVATLDDFRSQLTVYQRALGYFYGDSVVFVLGIGTAPERDRFYAVRTDSLFTNMSPEAFKTCMTNRKDMLNADTYRNWTTTALGLYQQLVAPAIDSTTTDLLIVPDGVLGYIPFESLLVSKANSHGPDYLLYHLKTAYSPSANVYYKLRKQPDTQAATDILGIFPYFEQQERGLATLENARQEETQLNQFRHVDIIDHAAAKTSAIKDKSDRQFAILHFSTHAGARDSQLAEIQFIDTSLNQQEIAQLKLHASLVVLSACETATGRFQKGEGVMGLARSFIMAGSNSVVATLWQVNDQTTAGIIAAFYNYLADGETESDALYHAKIDYLKATTAADKQLPFYWAAPVLIGNNTTIALQRKTNPLYYWVGGGLVLALAGGFLYHKRKKAA
jgi:CHAT domain-containing protein